MTIPELGTTRAERPPIVVLTSNRTRDLHDALKRRCLYHWIDYPGLRTAVDIIRRRVPAARTTLVEQVGAAVGRLRSLDVQKPPGIAEAIDWVAARRARHRRADAGRVGADRRIGVEVPGGHRRRGRAGLRVGGDGHRLTLDLAELAGRFGSELHLAGVPVDPPISGRFAAALAVGGRGASISSTGWHE